MLRWVQIMARTGAGRGRVKFGDVFFRWLWDQMLMVEDYAYAGTNFTSDLTYRSRLESSGETLVRNKKL